MVFAVLCYKIFSLEYNLKSGNNKFKLCLILIEGKITRPNFFIGYIFQFYKNFLL
jgi:hypothetical protein